MLGGASSVTDTCIHIVHSVSAHSTVSLGALGVLPLLLLQVYLHLHVTYSIKVLCHLELVCGGAGAGGVGGVRESILMGACGALNRVLNFFFLFLQIFKTNRK